MRAIALGSTTHDRKTPRGPRRRALLQGVVTLALVAGCERLSFLAPAKRVPRVGLLSLYRSDDHMSAMLLGSLRQGLRELGYVEGQTIVIDYRYGEARLEQLCEQATDLVRGGVDVIVVANT